MRPEARRGQEERRVEGGDLSRRRPGAATSTTTGQWSEVDTPHRKVREAQRTSGGGKSLSENGAQNCLLNIVYLFCNLVFGKM